MEGKHKSAVGEVADHLEQCRKLQKALGESEEQRAVAEKRGKLSETTLETIRSVKPAFVFSLRIRMKRSGQNVKFVLKVFITFSSHK